ncbi:MAG TPA: VOC family protein [Candidatus Binatus sp.]|jgi:catechol 2,3-dioxygenase-like lactoylglutathione lyase family enzyme|nr:VOC family protein [Candidatus Binatus sp.]
MTNEWPKDMPVRQVRIARPTDKLEEVLRFYSEGLGLKLVGAFKEHEGYTGYLLGLPGADYHLEFTQHASGSACPAPSRDNLLVFYIRDKESIERIASRLSALGYPSVVPENPYWKEKGVTIEDPDGWRVVLMNSAGI